MKKPLLKSQQRRGATAVEFAIVFPIVITIFTMMLAFSQAVLLRDTAQHAAYEGARSALRLQATSGEVEAAMNDFLDAVRVRGALIEIDPPTITSSTENVSITVRIPFSDNAWVAGPLIPQDWRMGANVTLEKTPPNEESN